MNHQWLRLRDQAAGMTLTGMAILVVTMIVWIDPYVLAPLWVLNGALLVGTMLTMIGFVSWIFVRFGW